MKRKIIFGMVLSLSFFLFLGDVKGEGEPAPFCMYEGVAYRLGDVWSTTVNGINLKLTCTTQGILIIQAESGGTLIPPAGVVTCSCKRPLIGANMCVVDGKGGYCGGDPCNSHDANCR